MEMVREIQTDPNSPEDKVCYYICGLLWFVTECARFRRMWICLNLADIIIADPTLDLAKSVIHNYLLPSSFGWVAESGFLRISCLALTRELYQFAAM